MNQVCLGIVPTGDIPAEASLMLRAVSKVYTMGLITGIQWLRRAQQALSDR